MVTFKETTQSVAQLFDDADGRPRMESALQMAHDDSKDTLADNGFTQGIVKFLKDAPLTKEQLTELCNMIIQYFPQQVGTFADKLDMPWLYNDIIKENIEKLRKLNITLYETIGRI